MKKILSVVMLLSCCLWLYAQNDYDPTVPPNPQSSVQKYTLYCSVLPDGAGSTSISSGQYEAGSKVVLSAYNHSNYVFKCWLNGNDTISKISSFNYVMPAKDVRLIAMFTYEPGVPANPDAPEIDPNKGQDDNPEQEDKEYDPSTPSNPGSNTYDPQTGIIIVDDFSAGGLNSAISKAISGYSSADVRQIIVQGNVNSSDISVANNYSNCVSIDFSRCPEMTLVPDYAYYGNSTLEQIILPSSLEKIGNHAFENTSKLSSIVCYAATPPSVGSNAFLGLPEGTVAYVPEKSVAAYKTAEGWSSLIIKAAKNQYAVDFTVTDVAFGVSAYAPQQNVTLSWTVNNEGTSDSNAGWKETIYLTNDDETSPLLYSLYYSGTLEAGKSVNRTVTFTLPDILGVSGDVKAKVVLMPNSNAGESVQAQSNNAGVSTQTANVMKRLYISSVSSVLQEGTSGISITLKRSGSCKESETISLKATPENMTNLPSSVSFRQKENTVRFIVSVPDNAEVNGIDSIYVTASSDIYDTVVLPVMFEDNDKYPLTVTIDKNTYAEGDTIHAVISVSEAVESPLPITLNIEHTKRFRMPSSVVIKQGERQVKVDIPVINDDIPSNDEGIELKASTEGYDVATTMFILTDDDVPAIEMTITPSIVSEAAGSEAIHAVIRRTGVVGNKITLRLTDDGNDALFYNNTITMEKGITEVTVPIGVKDNVKVDGTREVNLTASIYISSCNCSATGTKQSVVTETITILDNDGPTLSLSVEKTVIMEGDTNGAMFTLSRNNSTDSELSVKLIADAEGIVLPAQVTIPPGRESTTFLLYAKGNDVQEGNRVVNVKAQCEGYTMGTAYILVSDQTLPDMSIKSIVLSQEEVEVNQKYIATITVKNAGAAQVPTRSTVKVKTDNEEFSLTIPDAIAVGAEKVLTVELKAPEFAKVCCVTVTCNPNNEFSELQTINNSVSCTLKVVSPFTMTVSTDKKAYNMGEVVHLTGKVKSLTQNVAGIKVEPYATYLGARTALEAVTTSDGSFALDYTLPKGMAGDFSFGACLPGEEAESGVADVSVYGMARASSTYYKLQLYNAESYELSIPIVNLSSLPLTGIRATVEDESGHYDVKASGLASLSGNSEGSLDVKITSSMLSTSKSWERVMITLTSNEGARTSFPVYCYCLSHDAILELSTRNICSTITKGVPRVFPIILTNSGMGKTGKVSVDIPAGQKFVSLASPASIQSLNTGDSSTVLLRFNPEGLDVNVVQRGTIAVNCENGDGAVIAYSMKVVSDERGSLVVRVMDEFTEYGSADGKHPYVANSTVVVKDYNSGVTLYSGISDNDGIARFENMNEGAYTLYVTASKHDSYTQNVMVNPGEVTEHLAYVSYQAISVSFSVEETQVEDVYDIRSEFVYETQVPKPVVEMVCPDEIELQRVYDGGTLLYNVTLTNRGLINAENVCLSLPEAEGVDFVALNDYSGFTLAPNQTWTIPVYVRGKGGKDEVRGKRYIEEVRGKRYEEEVRKPRCSDETFLGFSYPCKAINSDKKENLVKVMKYLLRTCEPDPYKPGESKPDKRILTVEDEDPKDYPEERDPEIRRMSVKSQVDLYGMYQYACKLFCSMSCLGEGTLSTLKCVWKNASSSYAKPSFGVRRRTNALNSLFDNYRVKFDLLMAIDSLTEALDAEIVNAPSLREDVATYGMLKPAIDEVDENLARYHVAGTLYDKTLEVLYDENIVLMPQRMADWHDFSLPRHIVRQVNTFRKADGLSVVGDNYMDILLTQRLKVQIDSCERVMRDMGFVDFDDLLRATTEDAKVLSEASGNTCATVKFALNQQMVVTRQAFRGSMMIENSSDSRLTDISAVITATNEHGVQATAHEMQIALESSSGFMDSGNGTWTLEPGAVGIATYLFIPTKYAAPDGDQTYSFGGSLYFNDGEKEQARSLYPASLIVKPTPELDLTYFMQRDLYGDNPLTEDVKEPVIPAEFTVLIHNKGMGDAQNVRMITHQPQIVENEKGLLVEFAIIASSLNGENRTMALADDISTDFGTIAAGKCSYATWDLTCSLLGHIKEYNVGFTHVTSYDNPELSLLDNVTIHELIHSINTNALGGRNLRAWVTNDVADTYDLPDHIYFSNGTDAKLHPMPEAATVEVLSERECKVTVNTVTKEWFYTYVENPMDCSCRIIKITNCNTGEELDGENFWTTNYTMVDGKDPVEDSRLHVVDMAFGAGEVSYIVTFGDIDDTDAIDETVMVTSPIRQRGIYSIAGVKVSSSSTEEDVRQLLHGLYIINGKKVLVK